MGRVHVVLTDKGVQDVGVCLVLVEPDEIEVLGAGESPLANAEDPDRSLAVGARQPEEILVVAAHRQHLLALRHPLHRVEAVPVARRGLVLQLVGRHLHLLLEPLGDVVGASIEEARYLVQLLVVVLAVDEARARR